MHGNTKIKYPEQFENVLIFIFCFNRFYYYTTAYVAGRWPATSWVHYTTNCNTQSSAPEDG